MGPTDAEREALDMHGEGPLEELLSSRYSSLDQVEVKNQFLRLRHYVRNNHHRFYDGKKLLICGTGSILEALFNNSAELGEFSGISEALTIADDMIATILSQCNTERAGRKMTLIKNNLRVGLNDDIYNAALFLGSNMPPIHELDVARLVKEWLDGGHFGPYTRDGAHSLVLNRLVRESKKTMILKQPVSLTVSPLGRWVEVPRPGGMLL